MSTFAKNNSINMNRKISYLNTFKLLNIV